MQRKFGLIGKNIQYSKSKWIFDIYAHFTDFHNLSYEIIDTNSISKELLLQYDGLNITTPYKVEVIKYLDMIKGIANEIGSINCIKNNNGVLIGYNTDYIGFNLLVPKETNNILLLGNGGVSKMIRIYCKRYGINLTVCARSSSKEEHDIIYEEINDYSKYDCIINATKFGILPPIDYSKINSETNIIDLSYCDEFNRTVFLKEFLKYGHNPEKIKDGYSMLIEQAMKSYKIWGLYPMKINENL